MSTGGGGANKLKKSLSVLITAMINSKCCATLKDYSTNNMELLMELVFSIQK
jgi:hypothetical protein